MASSSDSLEWHILSGTAFIIALRPDGALDQWDSSRDGLAGLLPLTEATCVP